MVLGDYNTIGSRRCTLDMIWAKFCLYNLYLFLPAKLPQFLSDVRLNLVADNHSTVFWRKYHMVLAIPLGMC